MILSFSSYGQGSGKGPVRYVSARTKWNGESRSIAPALVDGNNKRTEKLIDSIERKHKYTSLTIAFTKEEYSKELEAKVIEEFKEAAFYKLDASQYDCLIYRHLDTENPHIHIIVPRVCLSTGTDLNIAPPGSQKGFWRQWGIVTRDKFNLIHIEQSDEIDRLPLSSKEKQAIRRGRLSSLGHAQMKLEIDEIIRENVSNGYIRNRTEVVEFLTSSGFSVKEKNNSISIETETRNIRLTGGLYERKTNNDGHEISYSTYARESSSVEQRDTSSESRTSTRSTNDYKKWINRIQQQFEFSLSRKLQYFKRRYKKQVRLTRQALRQNLMSLQRQVLILTIVTAIPCLSLLSMVAAVLMKLI